MDDCYIEIGRTGFLRKGPNKGEMIVIVDFLDHKEVVISFPYALKEEGRRAEPLRNIEALPIKIDLRRESSHEELLGLLKERNVLSWWKKHPIYLKQKAEKRIKKMTDFDRFRISRLQEEKRQILKTSSS